MSAERAPVPIEYHVAVRYIGSKISSLDRIASAIPSLRRYRSLCDPFAGVCTVARHFKSMGFKTITGDLLRLSYVFQTAYLRLNQEPTFPALISSLPVTRLASRPATPVEIVLAHLNTLQPTSGFITREYSLAGPTKRKFFTIPNARRIDAVSGQIRLWSNAGRVSDGERDYLLACLVDAADVVANTAGTYYAYLGRFYRKARKSLRLRSLHIDDNGLDNSVSERGARLSATPSGVEMLVDNGYRWSLAGARTTGYHP